MNSMRVPHRKVRLAIGMVILLLVALMPAVASAGQHNQANEVLSGATHDAGHGSIWSALARVRRATERFHDVDAAIEAGYELGYVNGDGIRIIAGCIADPVAGAMGYHYFNKQLIDDLEVDPLKPEGLLYEQRPNGELKLVAVEWVVPGAGANPPGVSEAPSVLGMEMHILVPAVGWYIQHAWIYKHNPSGVFSDWNPLVHCP